MDSNDHTVSWLCSLKYMMLSTESNSQCLLVCCIRPHLGHSSDLDKLLCPKISQDTGEFFAVHV